MAMNKSRIAVIIVLAVLGAALFVVALQSRWRGTTAINNNITPSSVSKQSGSVKNPSDVNKEPADSILTGSKYWNKAVRVVENLIKDKLKSDPSHTDPDLLATWQRQVSNQNPNQQSNLEKTLESVKKGPSNSEISSGDKKVKQTVTVTPPRRPTVPTVNRQDLPFLTRGSVEIRPERLPPPADSSDIYISLLTAPRFHDTRVSLQYLTWFQTVDPEQVQYHMNTLVLGRLALAIYVLMCNYCICTLTRTHVVHVCTYVVTHL